MRIHILHQSRYTYSQPVLLQPHILRFRPRQDPFQALLSHRLELTPPASTAPMIEQGGTAERAWFEGPQSALDIRAESVVEVSRDNPFRQWPEEWALELPLKAPLREGLPPLTELSLGPRTQALASRLLEEAKGSTQAYLAAAARALSEEVPRILRLEGPAMGPEQTLSQGTGSCRDLALLMMGLCQAQGIPARFVSGYFLEHLDRRQHQLHAWAEAWLPGAGWFGWDPSAGLACTSMHVAVCGSIHPELCSPVSGSFKGAATSALQALVEVKGSGPLP